jgi:hypothetical protein
LILKLRQTGESKCILTQRCAYRIIYKDQKHQCSVDFNICTLKCVIIVIKSLKFSQMLLGMLKNIILFSFCNDIFELICICHYWNKRPNKSKTILFLFLSNILWCPPTRNTYTHIRTRTRTHTNFGHTFVAEPSFSPLAISTF